MKRDGNFLETFFLAVFIAVAFIIRGIGFAGKMLLKGTVGVCRLVVEGDRWVKARQQVQLEPERAPSRVMDVAPGETPHQRPAVGQVEPDEDLEREVALAEVAGLRSIADCHVNVVFNDSFTASVALHSREGLVRRKMRAVSEAAGTLMRDTYGRETWELPDFQLQGGLTIEDAILDTERLGVRFLKGLLSGTSPARDAPTNTPVPASEEAVGPRALAILRADDEGTRVTESQPAPPPAEMTTTMRVRRAPGEVTRGIVVECGHRALIWQGGSRRNGEQGTTFEAILEVEDGSTASFRGVRLQEQFAQHEVYVGDLVEITSLGRTKVDIRGDKGTVERGMRNEFQVKVLERATQRIIERIP